MERLCPWRSHTQTRMATMFVIISGALSQIHCRIFTVIWTMQLFYNKRSYVTTGERLWWACDSDPCGDKWNSVEGVYCHFFGDSLTLVLVFLFNNACSCVLFICHIVCTSVTLFKLPWTRMLDPPQKILKGHSKVTQRFQYFSSMPPL